MHTEIERKFIVTDSTFKQSAVRIMDIRQGYVGTSSNGEARVSIRDEKAWVIIKSNGCLARLEYEIPIPKKDAEELLSFTCDRVIIKLVILFHVRIVCLNGKLMSFMVRMKD